MKILFLLFFFRTNLYRKTNISFELGNSYSLPSRKNNNTKIINEKENKFGDCALIPKKDIPKTPLLW